MENNIGVAHLSTSRLSVLCAIPIAFFGCHARMDQVKPDRIPTPEAQFQQDAFHEGRIEATYLEAQKTQLADIVLAILPFKNNTSDKSIDRTGEALADILMTRLNRSNNIKLVERQRIGQVLDELHFGDVGPVDPDTAMRIGGLLGANMLAFGSISQLGEKLVLTLRLVKVETGQIVGGVTEYGDSKGDLDVLATNAYTKLVRALSANGARTK